MKTLTEQVEELQLAFKNENEGTDNTVARAMAEIKRLRELGILKRPEYNLPLKDTIGKQLFSELGKKKSYKL
jgi:hypothetical protein